MHRTAILACAIAAGAIVMLRPVRSHAQTTPSPLGGVWSLNRALSTVPREIGFNVAPPPAGEGGQTSGSGGGGRGRRGSGGGGGGGSSRPGGPVAVVRESYLDGQRMRLATTEARNPPARLVIVDNPGAVTMTTELGESRTFHPNGREESIEIQATPINVTATRDGDRLIVRYHVEQTRDLQYTFSRSASPSQLIVDLELVEKGAAGDKARLIYEPGLDTGTRTATAAGANPPPPGTAAAPAGSTASPHETFDERPGAEFRGLKSLGVLVEDLGAQAIACGLNHDALESALSKRLTDGGFSVRRNSDEDTYLYVNVMTTSSSGTCTSRYDAFLYTTATANLSYRDRPALVQVSLIHRGGMASSAAVTHAATIGRGLEAYVDTFMTQIRQANQ